jgi:hypothetical protein
MQRHTWVVFWYDACVVAETACYTAAAGGTAVPVFSAPFLRTFLRGLSCAALGEAAVVWQLQPAGPYPTRQPRCLLAVASALRES